MRTIATIAAAATMAAGIGAAAAQSAGPAVPNPADPRPAHAVATNGSPLPHHVYRGGARSARNVGRPDAVRTGRSAYVSRPAAVSGRNVSTDRLYGNGPDGQGVTAPFLNGRY